MKKILFPLIVIGIVVVFWSCSKDSNPVVQQGINAFNAFALWDTASPAVSSTVQCLAVKDTFLFAGTSSAGIYRSTNNGDTWSTVNTGLVNHNVHAILVKDSILLAGTANGIYISTNNGSNWSESTSGMGNIVVYSLVAKDTSIFAGTADAVFQSLDDGATWSGTSMSTSYNVVSLCVRGNRLFAGTTDINNGLYRTTNNGVNWLRIVSGMPGVSVVSLAAQDTNLYAATADGVFRSSNDSTWTQVNDGLYSVLVGAAPTTVYAYGPNVLAGMSNNQGIYLSLNYGSSWVSANAGLFGLSVNCFAYNGSYLFVGGVNMGGSAGVWRHPL
jgi:hypothetical protein